MRPDVALPQALPLGGAEDRARFQPSLRYLCPSKLAHPTCGASIDQPMHGTDGVAGAAMLSVGVLFAGQVRLQDGSQHDDQSHLHYPVSQARNAPS